MGKNWWWTSQDKKTRLLLQSNFLSAHSVELSLQKMSFVYLLGLGLACLGLWVMSKAGEGVFFPPTRSSPIYEKILLPARETYGRISLDQPPLQRISFQFELKETQNFWLHFTAGNIQNQNPLHLFLNQSFLGVSSSCPDQWSIEQKILLPEGWVHPGINEIVFSLSFFEKSLWAVRQVYLTSSHSRTENMEEADSFLQSAEDLFRNRNSLPGQTVRSKLLLEKAIKLYSASGQEVPLKVSQQYEEVLQAESRLISTLLSQARAEFQLGGKDKARRIYEQLLQEMVDPRDLRRKEVLGFLSENPE